MGRFPQNPGERGSKKWIQIAVNQSAPRRLDQLISSKLPKAATIMWHSPLSTDEFAEYRDDDFLEKIGAGALKNELKGFWPAGGPPWDALGIANGEALLVEAKAHIDEMFSSPIAAGEASRAIIDTALRETALFVKAKPRGV